MENFQQLEIRESVNSKIHWLTPFLVVLFSLGLISCSPRIDYSGDGVLTSARGVLWNPIYAIQMPKIDISKPHIEKYDLSGIPSSEAFWGVALVVPASREITPSDRAAWGSGSFKITKNGEVVQAARSEFSKMNNNIFGGREYLNGFYMLDFEFTTSDSQDHWELTFECSGFDSPEPVWAYILLRSGGK